MAALLLAAGPARAATVHVRGGDLGAAVARAPRGARIVVHPGTYTGAVVLKPRQRLIGRGAPRLSNPSGDVVTLARGTTVRGLVITSAGRGGIYGNDVGRVTITGNDVSRHNTSCAGGFLIPPFSVPTTVPGVGVPISDGLQNGWAGIMVDADKGATTTIIRRNRVHDSACGDGIDVRASGTARVTARITRNTVSDLRQGTGLESVLAIGLQTRAHARMRATIDANTESGLGNPGDPPGPGGADSEGVFINPADASALTAAVTRNRYSHTPGRSGFSANGLEFVSMGSGARGDVTVRDSGFSGTPGDVLEQLALGTKGRLDLTLDRVVAKDSTGFSNTGEGNTVLIPGNNGDCLVAASGGAGNVVHTTIRRSQLTHCANNGLTFGSSVANGSGPTQELVLDVRDSTITGNQGNNLRIGNVTNLRRLRVRVQGTDLADARGVGSVTPADASFEDIGTTSDAVIDLGGGALGSPGGNCLDGGSLGAAAVRYAVSAQHNWWGGAPRAVGTVTSTPAENSAPARCLPARAAATAGDPDSDPFYAAPADLAAASPGAILRRRGIDVTALGIPLPVDGYQLLYRTKDTHGAPEAAVATVILPRSAPPAAGRPLLSYQPAEDSLTRRCASSYEIRNGQEPELPEALTPLLQQGAAVVVPDYEGPQSEWVAGVQAGRAVLDAIRATQNFAPAAVKPSAPVAVWGYSGGAQATAWAAELQPTYAPAVNLVASAHGAAPYVLRKTVAYLDGGPAAALVLAAVVGMGRAYPEMGLDDLLNDAGRAMKARIGSQCLEEFAGEYPYRRLDEFTKVPNAKDLPQVARVIDADDLGHRTPLAPTYLYQSATDELEPVAGADAIVANYCRRGAVVDYVRAPAGEHIAFQAAGAPGAAQFIAGRFAGRPAPNTCTVKPDPPRCPLVVRAPHARRMAAYIGGRLAGAARGGRLRLSLTPGRYTIRLRIRFAHRARSRTLVRSVNC